MSTEEIKKNINNLPWSITTWYSDFKLQNDFNHLAEFSVEPEKTKVWYASQVAQLAHDLFLERDWDMNPPEDAIKLRNAITAWKNAR